MEALLGLAQQLEDNNVFSSAEIKQLCLEEIREASIELESGISPLEIKRKLDRFAEDLIGIT